MEKNIKKAKKCIEMRDLSGALTHLHLVYSTFHKRKEEICFKRRSLSFKQIANSDCPYYNEWRGKFSLFHPTASKLLEIVEDESYRKEKEFTNMFGEDLLKKTITLRNHCDMFAKLQKTTEQKAYK